MTSRTKLAYSVATLAVGIGLILWHSIEFWVGAVGKVMGIGWALGAELLALWLWSQRESFSKTLLGGFVSIAVLAGPVHELAFPLLNGVARARDASTSEQAQLAALRARVATARQRYETVLENSKHRTGWLGAIEAAAEDLAEGQRAIENYLATHGSRNETDRWRAIADQWVVALEALFLVLFQVGNILIIRQLSTSGATLRNVLTEASSRSHQHTARRGNSDASESEGEAITPAATTVHTAEPSPDDPVARLQLQQALAQHLCQRGISCTAYAAELGLSKQQVIFALSDEERRRAGKRCASKAALRRLMQALLISSSTGELNRRHRRYD